MVGDRRGLHSAGRDLAISVAKEECSAVALACAAGACDRTPAVATLGTLGTVVACGASQASLEEHVDDGHHGERFVASPAFGLDARACGSVTLPTKFGKPAP